MESTTEIEWFGDAKERLIERAKAREDWGDYQGISHLGRRLIQEVTEKISEISKNLNLYSERNDEGSKYDPVPLPDLELSSIVFKFFKLAKGFQLSKKSEHESNSNLLFLLEI